MDTIKKQDNFYVNVRNKSFYKVYDQLAMRDIVNKDFLLEANLLTASEDLYSDNLSERDKVRLVRHCKDSIWYFLANVKIPVMGGETHYTLNMQNMSIIHLLESDMHVYSNACRQSYSVMTRCLYYLWRMIKRPSFSFNILSISVEESKIFIEKILRINDMLPDFIKLEKDDIKNRINVINAPKSVISAEKTFRGLKGHLFIQDFEYIKFIDVIHQVITPMKKSGFITVDCNSTVGKYGSISKKTADGIIMDSYRWFDLLLDVDLDHNCKDKFFYVKYNYDEIFDNHVEWYNNMCIMLFHDMNVINREILLIR